MKIVNKELIDKFAAKHANAVRTLDKFIATLENACVQNHNELKVIFPSADYVGNSRYVFNIKGNDYRLVAIITFANGLAVVRFIGTHAEYDKINCATI